MRNHILFKFNPIEINTNNCCFKFVSNSCLLRVNINKCINSDDYIACNCYLDVHNEQQCYYITNSRN